MTISELYKKVDAIGLDPQKLIGHKIDDYFHECQYFIRNYESIWQVFYWGERGNMGNLKKFNSESEATAYILNSITNDIDYWKKYCMKK